MRHAPTLALLASVLLSACDDDDPSPRPPAAAAGATSKEASSERATASMSLLSRLDQCDVLHRGLLLDLGTPAADSEREFAVGPFDDVDVIRNGGASFAAYRTRRIGYHFWLRERTADVHISFRGIAGAARRASVYLDHRRLGTAKLSEDDARVVTMSTIDFVEPGLHKVSFRFSGKPRTPEEPFAQLDWLRIGVADDGASEYAAPTRERLLADVVLDAAPRRSVVLRAPGAVRCPVRVVRGSRLEVDVGFWGTGKGKADVRVLAPGTEPAVVTERRVVGGKGATWTRLSLPLDSWEDKMIGLELRATTATPGGRVAFGEPAVVVDDPAPTSVPEAKVVVIVVAAGLNRRLVPPWGSVAKLPNLGRIARRGVAFDGYRAPSTAVGPVMATLLTGQSPRAHALEDPLSRLPNEVRAIGEIVKEASGRTAMFTGVPTSFSAFGFDRGWNRYEAYSPVRDLPATQPIEQAAAWLSAELEEEIAERHLLVVHTRGGHPPWDLSQQEAALLPPADYSGPLEPRRGASTLAEVRGSHHGKLTAEDWQRLEALELAALRKQDRALGSLLDVLDEHAEDAPYLLVFMGDVGTGDPPNLPFAPAPVLHEDHLIVPLAVVFPNRGYRGTHVASVTTTADVTATALRALGVAVPEGLEGRDLYRAAGGFEEPNGGAHIATLGSAFLTRWGPWLLTGELRRTPSLCQVEIDPACAQDAMGSYPGVASALWRRTYAEVTAASPVAGVSREPAVPDPETQAALKVIGYGY